jgi:prephenate dehydratase
MTSSSRVAILGSQASFHGQAALQFFGRDAVLQGFDSFKAVLQAIPTDQADFAVLAWENSLAGLVPGNQDLLRDSGLRAFAQVELAISFALYGLPGSQLEGITRVYSHPMAFKQVRDFLSGYPHWEQVPCSDTAEAVQIIQQQADPRCAALASEAAVQQGLDLLARQLQDRQDNCTRFLVLKKAGTPTPELVGSGEPGTDDATRESPMPGSRFQRRVFCSFCDAPAAMTGGLSGGEGLLELAQRGLVPLRVDCSAGNGGRWERIWHLEAALPDSTMPTGLLDWARAHLHGFVLSGIFSA